MKEKNLYYLALNLALHGVIWPGIFRTHLQFSSLIHMCIYTYTCVHILTRWKFITLFICLVTVPTWNTWHSGKRLYLVLTNPSSLRVVHFLLPWSILGQGARVWKLFLQIASPHLPRQSGFSWLRLTVLVLCCWQTDVQTEDKLWCRRKDLIILMEALSRPFG